MNYTVGVTGGMGCGKTYLCKKLCSIDEDFSHTSFDEIRRNILGTTPEFAQTRDSLRRIFGVNNLSSELNRIIYHNPDAMLEFKSQVYPIIIDEIAKNNKPGINLIEWALLAEDNLLRICKYNVLLVTCSKEKQSARLSNGDLSCSEIENRISMQLTSYERKQAILTNQKAVGYGDFFTVDTTSFVDYVKLLEEIKNAAK
jgi:dephospho-CoA kinase